MAIVRNEFLNQNERRAYPLHSLANRIDRAGRQMPNNLLVDANIWLPKSAGDGIYLSSLRVTPKLITLTLLASGNPFASNGGVVGGFVPVAVLRVKKPASAYKNYAVEALYPGVGGWIMLGQGAIEATDLTFSFNNPKQTFFMDRCVRSYRGIPVQSIGKADQVLSLTGLINMRGVAGATVTRKETRIIDGKIVPVAVIAQDLTAGRVAVLSAYAGVCGHRPISKTCNRPPIERINNVTPDCDGNINIEIDNGIVTDVRTGLVVDYPVGLSTICPPITPENALFIDPQTGGFVIPPTPPPEPSSSSTSDPSSMEAVTPEYCEDFGAAPSELEVRQGSFSIQSGRWVSAPSATEQLALDFHRSLDAIASYHLQVVSRPRTAPGSGFIIFGYQSINNFFFAGYSQKASPGFLNGRFFIGQKVASSVADPTDLAPNYKVLVNIPVPAILPNVDYALTLDITKPSPLQPDFLALFQANWNDGGPQNMGQYFQLSHLIFDRFGYAGLGTEASETEFALFGINCTEF